MKTFGILMSVLALTLIPSPDTQAQVVILSDGASKAAPAQKTPVENPQSPIRLTLTPAAEPEPPLKHKLRSDPWECKAGNAAPFYYRAVLLHASAPEDSRNRVHDKRNWEDLPLGKLPKEELRRLLKPFRHALGELEAGVRMRNCDWGWGMEERRGPEVFEFLLPELGELRNLARLLSLRARLEIAEGRWNDAVKTLSVGYRLAHDVAEPPILINGLVGIAIAGMMDERVREFIEAEGSPSMYWALASLPDPFIDLGSAIRFEAGNALRILPFLEDAETAERTPEQWRRLWQDAWRQIAPIYGNLDDLPAVGLIIKCYPRAKRDLIADGYSPKRVEAMPVGQVVAIHSARTYRRVADELVKWSLVPYPQARGRMQQAEERLRKEGLLGGGLSSREVIPLTNSMLPALDRARYVEVRRRRETAALQVIEAIRMYAAANEGRLPETLEQLAPVPAKFDPLTNKPFPYRLEGSRAFLEVTLSPGKKDLRDGRTYEIVIKPLAAKDGR